MRIAQRYLWRKSMKALAIAAPALFAAITLADAEPVWDAFSRSLIDLRELFYLLGLWVPMMIYLSMPVVLALAIGYAYALAIQDGEVVALHAAGVSARRLAIPAFVAALVGTAICASCSLYLLPASMVEFKERMFLAEKNMGPASLHEKRFNELKAGVDVYFEQRLSDSSVRNVIVHLREGDTLTTITAKLGFFSRNDHRLGIVFEDGYFSKSRASGSHTAPEVVKFARYAQELAKVYSSEDTHERSWGFFERHIPALLDPPKSLAPEDRAAWVVEGYKRIIQPLLCIGYAAVAFAIALASIYGGRRTITDALTRLIVALLILDPLYLVALGALSREPYVDHRVIFLYPLLILAAGAYAVVHLDRRLGLARPRRSAGSGAAPAVSGGPAA